MSKNDTSTSPLQLQIAVSQPEPSITFQFIRQLRQAESLMGTEFICETAKRHPKYSLQVDLIMEALAPYKIRDHSSAILIDLTQLTKEKEESDDRAGNDDLPLSNLLRCTYECTKKRLSGAEYRKKAKYKRLQGKQCADNMKN
nr:unnamed protein product [Callosobruchus analis]